MIMDLQSAGPERLDNKEGAKKEAWISLGRGTRGDLLGKLGWEKGDGGNGKLRKFIGWARCWW